jgi:tetratricopeptide (TPR) repeat protein
MNVTLTIQPADRPLRPARAWFLPGGTADWLDELTAWGIPLVDVRLYPLPGGALVVPPAGQQPQTAGRGLPYGFAGKGLSQICLGHVCLPVEARFVPDLTDDELAALADIPAVLVWHPVAGLVAFDPDEAIAVSQLLAVPPATPAAWNRAQPGIALSMRLLSIEPDRPFDPQSALDLGRDDIGRDAPQLEKLPRSPREPGPGIGAAIGRAVMGGIAGAVMRLTQLIPGGADHPTWVNAVQDWAQRNLGRLADGLQAQRHRELMRLLHQLQHDPDRGLRYALPLTGGNHRGLAPPGGKLGPRDTNFNLGRLGGGRPGDQWDAPAQLRQQLSARYRELANREIALGRHRRAAYILAELLGDFSAAAATLADGCHWREAAALYEHRLNQPLEAACCLELGGLLSEAAVLYERLGEHVYFGDLLVRLDRPDEAEQAYRRAVAARIAAFDFLAAARLLEEKVHAPAEARDCLLAGWRSAPSQRGKCLEELFNSQARAAEHDQAAGLIGQLRQAPDRAATILPLADVLAGLATRYPDAGVRDLAADATRLIAAERLPVGDIQEVDLLTKAVARLVPADRLLNRDAQRFASQRRAPPPRIAPRPPPVPWRLACEFSLPPGDWRAAVSEGDCFFAAGYRGIELHVVRGKWNGQRLSSAPPWNVAYAQGHPILLAVDSFVSQSVVVHPLGHPLAEYHPFPVGADSVSGLMAGSHRGIVRDTAAIAFGPSGRFHGLAMSGDGEGIACLMIAGRTVLDATHALALTHSQYDGQDAQPDAIPFAVRGDDCYIALGRCLNMLRGGKLVHSVELPGVIHSLAVSPPHTRTRIIAGLEQGGVVWWTDELRDKPTWFDRDLPAPIVCLNRGGLLVAASSERIEVYHTWGGQTPLRATIPLPLGDPPIAVLTPPNPDQFAIVTGLGRVQVYEVARAPR